MVLNPSVVLNLLLFIAVSNAFDFVRQSFKYVDENSDPCEDFYRHACPIYATFDHLPTLSYKKTLSKLIAKQQNRIWENLEIEDTLSNVNVKEVPPIDSLITATFLSQCVSEYDTHQLLEYVENFNTDGKPCRENKCLTALAGDKNCTRAAELIHSRLQENAPIEYYCGKAINRIDSAKSAVSAVSVILDGDLREGVEKVKDLVTRMIEILNDWIDKTPWAVNTKTVDAIKDEINQLHLYDNYAIVLREYLDYLSRLEQEYLKCNRDVGYIENEQLLCAIFAAKKTELPSSKVPSFAFFNFLNAGNAHPNIVFAYHFYDMAQHVEEFAGMLGAVGKVVGHEVSHTLIENSEELEFLPYFSNESMHCVTSQFQKTCDTFKENSCDAGDYQIDENGSDILGNQLAYIIFEKHYEGRLQDEYIKLRTKTVTMEQLFFYAQAFLSCSGLPGRSKRGDSHSTFNIRVNVLAQHPGFQKAFQCASDSKMMQSINKECIIFGESAPETKKR